MCNCWVCVQKQRDALEMMDKPMFLSNDEVLMVMYSRIGNSLSDRYMNTAFRDTDIHQARAYIKELYKYDLANYKLNFELSFNPANRSIDVEVF